MIVDEDIASNSGIGTTIPHEDCGPCQSRTNFEILEGIVADNPVFSSVNIYSVGVIIRRLDSVFEQRIFDETIIHSVVGAWIIFQELVAYINYAQVSISNIVYSPISNDGVLVDIANSHVRESQAVYIICPESKCDDRIIHAWTFYNNGVAIASGALNRNIGNVLW